MAEEILAKRKVVVRSVQQFGEIRYESVSVELSVAEVALGTRCYGVRHCYQSALADGSFQVSVSSVSGEHHTLEVRHWGGALHGQLDNTPELLLGILAEVLRPLEERALAANKLGQAMWDVWAAGFQPAGFSDGIQEAKEAMKEALEKRIGRVAEAWDDRFNEQKQLVETLRKRVGDLEAADRVVIEGEIHP